MRRGSRGRTGSREGLHESPVWVRAIDLFNLTIKSINAGLQLCQNANAVLNA